MLIAILIALGVSAGGILLLLIGLMVIKRVKTIRHPAVFKARVRITDGQFPGLKETWKRCYVAWVTTVLTTRKGLPLNIADVLPIAALDGVRDAGAGEVKGLGDAACIASFTMTTGARIEVALPADSRDVGLKSWQAPWDRDRVPSSHSGWTRQRPRVQVVGKLSAGAVADAVGLDSSAQTRRSAVPPFPGAAPP